MRMEKENCSFSFSPTWTWSLGLSNGPIQFESARKIWPLLELLAKITWVLARMLGFSLKFPAVKRKHNLHLENKSADTGNDVPLWETGKHWGNMCAPWMFLENVFSFCWRLLRLAGLSGNATWNILLVKAGYLYTPWGGAYLLVNRTLVSFRSCLASTHCVVKLSEVILQQTAY